MNDHSFRLYFVGRCFISVFVLIVANEVEEDDQNEDESAHAGAVFIQLVFHVDIIYQCLIRRKAKLPINTAGKMNRPSTLIVSMKVQLIQN